MIEFKWENDFFVRVLWEMMGIYNNSIKIWTLLFTH